MACTQDVEKALIWDFDGTLAYRRGGRWAGALLEVIRRAVPDTDVTEEQIRPYLQWGFPWFAPERPHPDICSADQWWQAVLPVFEAAFQAAGLDPAQARSLTPQVRPVYTNPTGWCLYDDVLPTLARLSARGWLHLILSNHVPELPAIAGALGLLPHVQAILNSAEIGYEKPHPLAFRAALDAVPGVSQVWMIGDSPGADVAGARAVGLPAILVRGQHPDAEYACESLAQVPDLLAAAGENRVEGI